MPFGLKNAPQSIRLQGQSIVLRCVVFSDLPISITMPLTDPSRVKLIKNWQSEEAETEHRAFGGTDQGALEIARSRKHCNQRFTYASL